MNTLVTLSLLLLAQPQNPAPATRPSAPVESALVRMRKEAAAMAPLVQAGWVKQFLAGVERLPRVEPRRIYEDEKKRVFFSHSQFYSLGSAYRQRLVPNKITDIDYYFTHYGTPLAYARPLDILARNGIQSVKDAKILDFGYGTIGHLRLLAQLGATAHGIDVDTRLAAMYSDPADQGAIPNPDGSVGTVTVFCGRWPADESAKKEIGDGYDIFLAKNTLKMGYIHPMRQADDRRLIKLGVDDAAFLKALNEILKPGGIVLIYNLSPALSPPDKPFLPWTDGRCPFARETWEAAGFELIKLDEDDTPAARDMARALGWDKGKEAMDVEKDLFAGYTLARKKAG